MPSLSIPHHEQYYCFLIKNYIQPVYYHIRILQRKKTHKLVNVSTLKQSIFRKTISAVTW